ncbi:hypothetical protein EYZ11_012203 [Aspergillus tanneri]|uniref:Uncharacterized protein n=1 Tax=Aspergillus tanneri TaxID=1220188 RepID=A0A4V6RQM8_9EURO|nr:hypothetical protein EYZ11_012203 [Aspergillus tanneri]
MAQCLDENIPEIIMSYQTYIWHPWLNVSQASVCPYPGNIHQDLTFIRQKSSGVAVGSPEDANSLDSLGVVRVLDNILEEGIGGAQVRVLDFPSQVALNDEKLIFEKFQTFMTYITIKPMSSRNRMS